MIRSTSAGNLLSLSTTFKLPHYRSFDKCESSNTLAFLAIADFTEELDVSFRIRPSICKGYDVIKFEMLIAATSNTSTFISLPNKKPHRLRDRFTPFDRIAFE